MVVSQSKKKRSNYTFIRVLSSNKFFIGIAILFFLQMAWVALFSIYPMLFDEEYHLGIIDIYSRQTSPFIGVQPSEAAFHGDITRYSSYFFHYLMSYPYRIISFFTDDLMTKIILLRFICISLVLGGFIIFRKFLIKAGLSRAATHSALLIFTLIPLVPFALAQLNYDALLFLLIPIMLYASLKTADKNQHQARNVLLLLITGFIASVTKFTSLPIFLGCVIFVSIMLRRHYGKQAIKIILDQYKTISRLKQVIVSVFLLLSFGLVVERYGVNLATYQKLEPRCDVLHTKKECSEYTVYRRDTKWKAANDSINKPRQDVVTYTQNYWAPHIFNDFFVTGAFVRGDDKANKIRELPTRLEANSGNNVPRTAGWVVLWVSVALIGFLALRRQLRPKRLFLLVGLVLVIYSAALFTKNYTDYLSIGSPTAAQGRYFIPLLIPILGLVVVSLGRIIKQKSIKISLVVVALVIFSQGGGVGSYILYSNQKWYWSQNRDHLQKINNDTRQVLRRFIAL